MEKIKKTIRECALTSRIYMVLSRIKGNVVLRTQKRTFERKSIQLMQDVQQTLEECDVVSKFFFMFGTLLGAYRDKALIKNDMDIDVGVYLSTVDSIKPFRLFMENRGYKLVHYYRIDGEGIFQDSYVKNKIKVDVAFLGETDDYDYCYLMYDSTEDQENVMEFSFNKISGVKPYYFSGIQINIPSDPEQYLLDTYGPDWEWPNPNYKYWENPNAKKIEKIADICIL